MKRLVIILALVIATLGAGAAPVLAAPQDRLAHVRKMASCSIQRSGTTYSATPYYNIYYHVRFYNCLSVQAVRVSNDGVWIDISYDPDFAAGGSGGADLTVTSGTTINNMMYSWCWFFGATHQVTENTTYKFKVNGVWENFWRGLGGSPHNFTC